MEIVSATVIMVALITILVVWVWRVLNWLWIRPKVLERKLREQGLRGNSYRILFGDTNDGKRLVKEAISKPIGIFEDTASRILPQVDQCLKKYGKNSFLWMGPAPRINIMEPEMIREIFSKLDDFHKVAANPLTRLLLHGLTSHEGDQWAKHRKLLKPAFHLEKLMNMLPAFYTSCLEMMTKWEKLFADGGPCELDVWPYLQDMTSDAISRTAFGSSFREGKRIFERQRELADLVVEALKSVYIPGWRFLPTKMNRRMKELERDIRTSLGAIIHKKEMAMKAGEAASDDLLGILIESNHREIEENVSNHNVGLTLEEVIGECKIFYFAGQETTSTLLVWTMVVLSIHQEWQARARDEVLLIFGKEKPHLNGLNHLKIVTMIFHEVLRLYPPIATLNRSTQRETKLGRLTLPAGAQLSLPVAAIHRDPELWGQDAKEFKPERFADGVSKATQGQLNYFPFGWGPRICIGQNFAFLEAKMTLALMLQRFSFALSPSYTHAPYASATVHPQHGAHLTLHKL
uniref:Cytochrome P450 n=1 Tax=Kalanchoe fedtschenkoi TaxID=63787 RepID=A0A7N0VEY6_KALFE